VKLISFDPASSRNLGWAIVETDGNQLVRIEANTYVLPDLPDHWYACWPIFQFADNLLAVENPDIVIVEQTSSFGGGKNFVRGQVSHSMGCILAATGKHSRNLEYVFPTHVKKVVTDNGKASKSVMKKAAAMYNNGEKIKSEHAADALCNIVCYLVDQNIIERKPITFVPIKRKVKPKKKQDHDN